MRYCSSPSVSADDHAVTQAAGSPAYFPRTHTFPPITHSLVETLYWGRGVKSVIISGSKLTMLSERRRVEDCHNNTASISLAADLMFCHIPTGTKAGPQSHPKSGTRICCLKHYTGAHSAWNGTHTLYTWLWLSDEVSHGVWKVLTYSFFKYTFKKMVHIQVIIHWCRAMHNL